jgi:hypothetical protein
MPLYCEISEERCDKCGELHKRTWFFQAKADEPLRRYCDECALDVAVAIGCNYESTTLLQLQEAIRIVERIAAIHQY